MDKKELLKWKKANENADKINLNYYISDRGLELIKNLEGHKSPKMVGGIMTSYYGMTQAGLDGLKTLSTKYHVQIPSYLIGKDVKTLTEEQAREATAYTAVLNTMLVDDFTGTVNFSTWDIDTKDAFLAYFHNQSPYGLRKSLNKQMEGSVLYHIQKNNRYRAAQALMENPDGTFAGEYFKNGKLDGMMKRRALPCFAMGDPDFVYNEEQAREMEQRMRQPDFIKECHRRMGEIDQVSRMYNVIDALKDEAIEKRLYDIHNLGKQLPKEEEPKEEEKQKPEEPSAWDKFTQTYSDFTNALKNLLTNKKERPWQYTGNIDLANRPRVKNKDGSISTVRSMSYNEDGKEILIPTVSDEGRIMEDKDAISYWKKKGRNLGVFNSVDEANFAAENIHKDQERRLSEIK